MTSGNGPSPCRQIHVELLRRRGRGVGDVFERRRGLDRRHAAAGAAPRRSDWVGAAGRCSQLWSRAAPQKPGSRSLLAPPLATELGVEEIDQRLAVALALEDRGRAAEAIAVPNALQQVVVHVQAGRSQRIRQHLGVFDGDGAILIAFLNQERRVVLGDVGDRVGLVHQVRRGWDGVRRDTWTRVSRPRCVSDRLRSTPAPWPARPSRLKSFGPNQLITACTRLETPALPRLRIIELRRRRRPCRAWRQGCRPPIARTPRSCRGSACTWPRWRAGSARRPWRLAPRRGTSPRRTGGS